MNQTDGYEEKICWRCGETFDASLESCPTDGARLLVLTKEDLADPRVGQLFDGRYRVVRKLGEGGMGNVYAARDMEAQGEVALKLLKSDFLRDEVVKRRFLYEARVLSELKHPNALRVYDFGQAPDATFYMVMELLEGESLAERLGYRFLTYREIFSVVLPVCGVLGEAHANDVVHRDLKPENIFLAGPGDEQVKLLDFGIAKHLTGETITQTGTMWGTPAYMSPEQAKGERVSAAADVYAMGVILYELISGNLPFHASTQMGLAVCHASVAARSLLSIPGLRSVPVRLDDVVLRCLNKDPALRPGSMEELAVELSEVFGEVSAQEQTPAEEVDAIALEEWRSKQPMVEELTAQVLGGADVLGVRNTADFAPLSSRKPWGRWLATGGLILVLVLVASISMVPRQAVDLGVQEVPEDVLESARLAEEHAVHVRQTARVMVGILESLPVLVQEVQVESEPVRELIPARQAPIVPVIEGEELPVIEIPRVEPTDPDKRSRKRKSEDKVEKALEKTF